jgi:hypothetical protein
MKLCVILGVLLLIFVVGCSPKLTACTEEAKLCPDGTAVGRIGPNCEFAECPSGEIVCEPDERDVDGCPEIYQPVCGWNDAEKIQCITYPGVLLARILTFHILLLANVLVPKCFF